MGNDNLSDYRTTIEVLKEEFCAPLAKNAAFGFLLNLAECYRHELAYELAEKCIEQFCALVSEDQSDKRSEQLIAIARFHLRFGEYDRATKALSMDSLSTNFAELGADRHEEALEEKKQLDRLFKTSLSV